MASLGQLVEPGTVERCINVIFPNQETHVNARKNTNLRHPITGKFLELDFWVPNYDIAFEYQDSHHYSVTWYSHISKGNVQRKDNIKKEVTRQHNISLVIVPCWWDGSVKSLEASINFDRPDLSTDAIDNIPIPLNPSFNFFPSKDIPDVGELMLASFASELKHNIFYRNANWWVGEKYDGVRICWSPLQRELYTRAGNELPLIHSMTNLFPPVFLDGELWFGRASFGSTYPLFKGDSEEVNWHFLRIVSFDVPSENLQKIPFEFRYRLLLSSISCTHPFILTAQRMECSTHQQLAAIVEGIIDNKGEGVIMRKEGSKYVHGRSPSLIKMKTSFADKEAIVVGVTASKAVRLKQPNGKTFLVPAPDVHIPTPSVGDVVTYYYESSPNKETPQNPTIYRVRTDVSWEDVLRNAAKEKQYLNEYSRVPALPTQPHRKISTRSDIAWQDIRRRRKFFEDFAVKNGFDPLNPKHWYSQPKLRDKLLATKGVANIFAFHKGSLSRALIDLFPNIGLEKSKLWNRVEKWEDKRNRRKFYENYAKESGFDPLVPENWYSHPVEKVMATKWIAYVNQHHNRSVSQALLDLFPEIGLEKSKLWFASWRDGIEGDEIDEKAFYSKRAPNSNTKKAYSQAPIYLFDDSGWARLKFWDRRTWHNVENRRKFFLLYAQANRFDPKIPENWYAQDAEKIRSSKGAAYVLYHHKKKISQALVDLFPDIGLDKALFSFTNETSSNKKLSQT